MADQTLDEIFRLSIAPAMYSKIFRKILIFNAIFGIILSCTNFSYLVYIFDGNVLSKYTPSVTLCLHPTVVLLMIAYTSPKIKYLLEVKEQIFWSIPEHANKSTKNRIKFEIKVILGVCRTSIVCATDKYIAWLLFAVEIQWIVFTPFTTISIYILLYFVILFRFQLYVLHGKIQAIFDLTDQEEIYHSLIAVVEKHIQFKQNIFTKIKAILVKISLQGCLFSRYTSLIHDLTMNFALTYLLIGVINNLTFLTVIFLDALQIPMAVVVFFAFMLYVLLGIIIHSGQAFENNFEEIFSVCCQAPWYKWDKRSKTIYKMLLTNTIGEVNLYTTRDICINYSLIIKIYKAVFAAVNLLYSIAARN